LLNKTKHLGLAQFLVKHERPTEQDNYSWTSISDRRFRSYAREINTRQDFRETLARRSTAAAPSPPLHASLTRVACSRRRARRRAPTQRHVAARASAAVAEEASGSGPAKFSVSIPVGEHEVSASELHFLPPRAVNCCVVLCLCAANRCGCVEVWADTMLCLRVLL
jgi:hypothetical protein